MLDTLAAQHAPDTVITAVRSLLAAEDEIDAARYQPQRATELKRERRAQAVGEIAAELIRLEQQLATSAADDDAAQRVADHERVASANGGQSIDPHRFTAASTAAEIVVLLRDAEAADADTLRRAWGYAEPRLRAMAAQEQRTYRAGANSAFNALTLWGSRMKSLTQRVPDRSQLADVIARRQREARERVLAAADVVGLRQQVLIALRKGAAPEPPKSTMVVGGFFDRFASR